MTLRLRLLVLVVVIVVAGLAISDVVTYTSLRSFLLTRVDQQLEAATFPVERALVSPSSFGPLPDDSGAASTHATTPTTTPGQTTTAPPGRTGSSFHAGGGFGSPGRGSGAGVLVPPGTYGELLTGTGKVKAHVFFSYGGKAPAAPAVPPSLPGSGGVGTSSFFFTTSSAGNGVTYRAVARPLPDGAGTIVVAQPLTDLESTLGRLLLIETVVSLLLLAVLGSISWIMVRRDMRPLNEMAETAGAIAEGDLSQRVSYVTPGTEVGELGLAFNTMLGRIEEAFAARAASEERLRRFLADASHELRTPLTSILGYAEIFDLGVRDRPADLATSMHYIRNEAARMGTLVDDLFLLAQLDRERPLTREPVDLAEVVRQSVTGFEASAPQRRIAIEATGPVPVVGDPHRLRQVVDNLVGNAVTHTPDGTDIRVETRVEGSEAVLTVHDDGPGIDPDDVGRIFEPFFRSDPSRARATGGAGLGLAIVSAIVAAHGGTVAVVPGEGTTFEVRIEAGPIDPNRSPVLSDHGMTFERDKSTALRGEIELDTPSDHAHTP
ncbi:MAG: sensor histidine kinase [Acidimicrobiales bacterium]